MNMNTRETIENILKRLHPDVDFEKEKDLIEMSLLDSFDIVVIVTDINDELQVSISPERISPENFSSLDALSSLVEELMKDG